MFDRDRQPLIDGLNAKFAKAPDLAAANVAALNAGHAYGETAELAGPLKQHHVDPAPAATGLYRTLTGAEGISLGLVAGAQLAKLPIFLGSYAISPAQAITPHPLRLYRQSGSTGRGVAVRVDPTGVRCIHQTN